MRGRYNIKGFSLIELLITTTLVSVLSALSIANYGQITKKAIDISLSSDVRNLYGLIEAKAANSEGLYTDDLSGNLTVSNYAQTLVQIPEFNKSSTTIDVCYRIENQGIAEICACSDSGSSLGVCFQGGAMVLVNDSCAC